MSTLNPVRTDASRVAVPLRPSLSRPSLVVSGIGQKMTEKRHTRIGGLLDDPGMGAKGKNKAPGW